MKPAIVVIAYNRPRSIARLLDSINKAAYDVADIPLIISIDHASSEQNREVIEIANKFQWKYGEKRVVTHDQNLGLRKHVLSCGDLSEEFGSIIVLEDDLYVSPAFYRFSTQALSHYQEHQKIAGISLYSHRTNIPASLPFMPIHDGFDVFFFQFASSWGQTWTDKQWKSFRTWYDEGHSITADEALPTNVKSWPESSWLKYFIKYMVENDLYFVYPRIGYSTNCSDAGTHAGETPNWQIPLAQDCQQQRFPTMDESIAIYDSYFELSNVSFNKIIPQLAEFEITIDLYGRREQNHIHTEYVLTSQPCKNPIKQYRFQLKPMELNALLPLEPGIQGDISLCKTKDLGSPCKLEIKDTRVLQYFYGRFPFKQIAKKLVSNRIRNIIRRK